MSPGLLTSSLASSRRALSISKGLRPNNEAQAEVQSHALAHELLLAKANESNLTSEPHSSIIRRGEDSTSKGRVRSEVATCTCEWKSSIHSSSTGCIITKAAPSGFACKCVANAYDKECVSYVELCADSNTISCTRPSTDVYSCVMGRGNCYGYSACDCDYHWGGCTISKAAPPGLACACVYEGVWTCRGQATYCHTPNNVAVCIGPNYSYESCMNGGGDCGGY